MKTLLPLPALMAGLLWTTASVGQEHDVLLAQAPLPVEDTLAFAASELGGERIVKGAPYCADAMHEHIQTLADGNRIVRRQLTKLCRDGEGRMRQETEHEGRKRVYLNDPVARERWQLDPEHKTALRLGSRGVLDTLPPLPDASTLREYSERMREFAEHMREWGREFGERVREWGRELPGASDTNAAPAAPQSPKPPHPPAPAWISPFDAQHGSGDLQVRVLRLDGPEVTAAAAPGAIAWNLPLPHGIALRSQMLAPRGPGVSISLGSKDMEGVRVNGERTTWTIEAGKLGNEKPIVITREVWTSPELMLTVYSRDFDPRNAEVVYRLTRLKRGEPDAALMRVPVDYEVRGGRRPSPKAPAAPASKG